MTKEERECLIFGMFAQVAGLMPHGSFTNRKPPEPDILYVDAIGAQSAFELVEIIDRDYSSSIGRQLGTKDLCNSWGRPLFSNYIINTLPSFNHSVIKS